MNCVVPGLNAKIKGPENHSTQQPNDRILQFFVIRLDYTSRTTNPQSRKHLSYRPPPSAPNVVTELSLHVHLFHIFCVDQSDEQSITVLGRAIHALGRIGDELYIEPLPEGLSFRTVNSTKSAYAMVIFSPEFFSEYSTGNPNGEHQAGVKCKIAMKSCLSVFKYPASMSKQVSHCKIKLDVDSSKLIFKLKCQHDIVKTHYLTILDCETLQAFYAKDAVPNKFKAQTKILLDAVNNFQTAEEEVTLEATQNTVLLRNYVDNVTNNDKVMRTQLALKSSEFDLYTIGEEAGISFSLKELRAVLNFAESLNLSVSCSFETAGRPIVFVLSNESTFEANFVMATLNAENETQSTTVTDNNTSKSVNASRKVQKRPSSAVTISANTSKSNKHIKIGNKEDLNLFNFVENKLSNSHPPSIDLPRGNNVEESAVGSHLQNGSKTNKKCVNGEVPVVDLTQEDNVQFENRFGKEIGEVVKKTTRSKEALKYFRRCYEATYRQKTSNIIAGNSDCEES